MRSPEDILNDGLRFCRMAENITERIRVHISALTPTEIATFTDEQIPRLTPEERRALTPEGGDILNDLRSEIIAQQIRARISTFTPEQIAALIPTHTLVFETLLYGAPVSDKQIASLTLAQRAALVEQIHTLTPAEIRALVVPGFTLSDVQIRVRLNALTPAEICALTPEQIAALADHMLALNRGQIHVTFTPEQIHALTPEQIRALTSTLTPEQMAALRSALIKSQELGAPSGLSEDQIFQKRTKEKEEISTPIKPPDTYSKTYHLNKINNTDAQLALDRLLEEMGKKSSVLIKYFPNTIAIFIGSYKFMHITTMPSYFSLHIYRKFEGDTLSSFQKISKNVKIDNDGVDIKIEKVSEVEDLIKLNL